MAKNLNATTAASVTTKKARAPRAPKKSTVTMDHAVMLEPTAGTFSAAGDDDLDSLLKDLGVSGGPASDEILEPVHVEPLVIEASLPMAEEGPSSDDLEAAVSSAEAATMMTATAADDAADGSAPTGDATDVVEAAAAPAAASEKKASTPRVRYTDKVERLKARVGDKLSEYSVLTTADVMAGDTEEALDAVMSRTMDIIKAMNKKVGNRGVGFIEWLSGKKTSLNNVIHRLLELLDKDQYLQTGDEGNVMKNLLARPYSAASARAMGGNTVVMLKELKVILPLEGHKGRFVANPDSLLLMKARSLLSAGAASDDSAAEGGDES